MGNSLAVIFDVDGVLVDSYQAHFESWRALAVEFGLRPMTEAEFRATFGRTSRDIIAELWPQEEFSDERIADLDQRKEAAYRRIVEQDFPAMEGARELIDALHAAGFLLAAGSSGPPENTLLALERLGRRELFQAVVTGRDVTRGKPDPQVFLLAAERLGVPPKNCAVIEDAAVGVAAANAAGMLSIALVSTGHSRSEYAQAAHVVDRLDALSPELIRGWIAPARGRAG